VLLAWLRRVCDPPNLPPVMAVRSPFRAGSSAGQSSGLIIRRSEVRVLPGPSQDPLERKKAGKKKIGSKKDESSAQLIDARIEELDDWRGEMLSRLRALIKQADPEVVEEWKWRGVPVWSHDGLICTGETYKTVVKLTFAKGASLKDPSGLFNSSLDGNVRRAIDIHEGEAIDEDAFRALIRAAVTLNES
jgi:hypothetical protein